MNKKNNSYHINNTKWKYALSVYIRILREDYTQVIIKLGTPIKQSEGMNTNFIGGYCI